MELKQVEMEWVEMKQVEIEQVLCCLFITSDTDESALFCPYGGSVTKVNVIVNYRKQVGKDYSFVTMSTYDEAMNAIQQLSEYMYFGKPLPLRFKSNRK